MRAYKFIKNDFLKIHWLLLQSTSDIAQSLKKLISTDRSFSRPLIPTEIKIKRFC